MADPIDKRIAELAKRRGLVTVRITWERLLRWPEREAERLWRILLARRAA